MTDEPTLTDAITEVKRATEKSAQMGGDSKWSAHDFEDDPAPIDDAIARILNAVVSGELVPPANECPFGDDCDLTVAYMAGAASRKNASMMTASELAADDKDATIARLTEQVNTLTTEKHQDDARAALADKGGE